MDHKVLYKWRALYQDGTIVDQFDSAGVERSTKNLKDSSTFIFRLEPTTEAHKVISIEIKPNTSLVYIRRHIVSPAGETEILIAGFQWRDTGRYKLLYAYADGQVEERDSL